MEVLLLSNSKKVFEKTKKISQGWFKLIWWKYGDLQRKQYPIANIVIMDFDRERIIEGVFLPVIKIKSKMGSSIPILIIIDGTPQEIYSILKIGAYDYITTIEDSKKYERKIEEIALWDWYQKKYEKNDKCPIDIKL